MSLSRSLSVSLSYRPDSRVALSACIHVESVTVADARADVALSIHLFSLLFIPVVSLRFNLSSDPPTTKVSQRRVLPARSPLSCRLQTNLQEPRQKERPTRMKGEGVQAQGNAQGNLCTLSGCTRSITNKLRAPFARSSEFPLFFFRRDAGLVDELERT